jgi:galactitol-specific phosphotransferase system IIC component
MGVRAIRQAIGMALIFVIAVGAAGEARAKQISPTVLTMAVADAGTIPVAGTTFAKSVDRLSASRCSFAR